MLKKLNQLINKNLSVLAIKLIYLYKYFLSPYFGRSCRFYPTCSSYAVDSINTYGVFKAIPKILYRILRCNPFNSGGYDPIKKRGT